MNFFEGMVLFAILVGISFHNNTIKSLLKVTNRILGSEIDTETSFLK